MGMGDSQSKGYLRDTTSFAILFKLFDGLLSTATLYAVVLIYPPTRWGENYFFTALVAVIVFYLASESVRLYRSWRGARPHAEFFCLLRAWAATLLILLLVGYATKSTAEYSRVALGAWALGVPLVLGSWRLVIRSALHALRARGYNTRRVAVVGAGELGVQVADGIACAPGTGMSFMGFFEDRAKHSDRVHWEGEIQGDFDDVVAAAASGRLDMVYITLPLSAQPRIMDLVDRLADTTASVYLVPDLFVFSLFQAQWSNLGTLPIVSVFDTPFWGLDGALKRAQDIVLSSLILLLIAIPMLLIAAAIKLTSPGPVLFRQRRYGLDGKEIHVWKFRSMSVQEDGAKVVQASRNDQRVTPVGKFLRRTSLDELPQFINAWLGGMSIVGPRPHAVVHNEQYRGLIHGYMRRHAVKPGITGWAQVNGWRGETDVIEKMEKRVEHDLWYIRNWSFWLDIKIIFLTVFKGFTGESAY